MRVLLPWPQQQYFYNNRKESIDYRQLLAFLSCTFILKVILYPDSLIVTHLFPPLLQPQMSLFLSWKPTLQLAPLPFSGGLRQRHLGAPVHGYTINGQVNKGRRKGWVRSHRMPPDFRWQESSWRRGGGPARLNGIVATKILVFSVNWSQIKFAETEFGTDRKMALIIKPAEGRTQ